MIRLSLGTIVHETIPEPTSRYEQPTKHRSRTPAEATDYRLRFRELLHQDNDGEFSVVDILCREQGTAHEQSARNVLAAIRQQLHAAGVDEVPPRPGSLNSKIMSTAQARSRAARDAQEQLLRIVEAEVPLSGRIANATGERRVVAARGTDRVGKTTTVAKWRPAFACRNNAASV